MEEPTCPDCQALRQRNAQLEAQVADLTRQLQDALRAGKRQAAPFRKGPPKANPKTPGRKAGDAHGRHGHRPEPPTEQLDECHDVPLPNACPHCQGHLREGGIVEQFQTDIPRRPIVRQFRIHVGHCSQCGRRVQGRHPLQTSDAVGAAASQIGPEAQAAASLLHYQAGLSHGKVAAVFDTLFGINLSRGASAQIGLRTASRLTPDYQAIQDDLRDSEQIAADETGWRIGGQPAWLHAWVGERATCYAIDPQRRAAVLEQVIGVDYDGMLGHDGLASYGRFKEAVHQQCLAHPLRRARDLLAVAKGGAVHFPRRLIALFGEAIHERNRCVRGEIAAASLQARRDEFDDRLSALLRRPRVVPEYEQLAQHLLAHFAEWFAFVSDPSIEATNWRAEQAIRPAVVNRKVWGGNRTESGACAQGIVMSVMETCRRQGHAVVDYLSHTLRSVGNLFLPRPVLLPTR